MNIKAFPFFVSLRDATFLVLIFDPRNKQPDRQKYKNVFVCVSFNQTGILNRNQFY